MKLQLHKLIEKIKPLVQRVASGDATLEEYIYFALVIYLTIFIFGLVYFQDSKKKYTETIFLKMMVWPIYLVKILIEYLRKMILLYKKTFEKFNSKWNNK